MAEHLRFHEAFRNGSAVKNHHRPIHSRARIVNGPGHKFLPGPGFPQNTHVGICFRRLRNAVQHLLHGLRCPNQEWKLSNGFVGDRRYVLRRKDQATPKEGATNAPHERLPIRRHDHDVEHASGMKSLGKPKASLLCDNDHRRSVLAVLQEAQQIVLPVLSVCALQLGNDSVKSPLAQNVDGRLNAVYEFNLNRQRLQHGTEAVHPSPLSMHIQDPAARHISLSVPISSSEWVQRERWCPLRSPSFTVVDALDSDLVTRQAKLPARRFAILAPRTRQASGLNSVGRLCRNQDQGHGLARNRKWIAVGGPLSAWPAPRIDS